MTYKIVTAEQIDPHKWDEFVLAHPQGTYFHSRYMYKVLSATPLHHPFAWFAIDNHGEIAALLAGFVQDVGPGIFAKFIKRSVVTQAPIYTNIAAMNLLLQRYLRQIPFSVIYSEIRNHYINDDYRQVASACGLMFEGHLNYLVDCSDPDATWRSISESRRRQIKKADKQGVKIIDDPSLEQVRQFYELLKTLYREKIKKPLPAFTYFKSLYELGDQNFHCKFLLIVFNDVVIGGIVSPVSVNKAIHENYIVGLDQDYRDCYPSVMATWAAIDYACKHGIASFDFMGAGSPKDDYGVRDFKARFGGNMVEPGRFIYLHHKLLYGVAQKAFNLLISKQGKA